MSNQTIGTIDGKPFNKIKSGTSIYVKGMTNKEKEDIQLAAFASGFTWGISGNTLVHFEADSYVFSGQSISYGLHSDYVIFSESNAREEITMSDIFPSQKKRINYLEDGVGGEPVQEPFTGITQTPPPVGTVCEYSLGSDCWFECEIISHNKLVIDCPHLDYMGGTGLQVVGEDQPIWFRPKGYIEAKEKELEEEWVEDALSLDCHPLSGMLSRKDFCKEIYRALKEGGLKTP